MRLVVRRVGSGFLALVGVLVVVGLCGAAAARADGQAWWHVDLSARPASIPAGGDGELVVRVENVGDAQAVGPVTVADALPGGLRATGIVGVMPKRGGAIGETVALSCSLEHLSCEAAGSLAPYDAIEVRIGVEAAGRAERGSEHGRRFRWGRTVRSGGASGLGRAAGGVRGGRV